MEVRHLRYFIAVAEELNFRRAAHRLNISQPPLSLQIQQLEHEVGSKLFDRSQQRVALTATGRVLLEHARQVIASIEQAKAAVRLAETGEGGELRIGFTPSAEFQPFLPMTVRNYRERHPGVLLTLLEMSSTDQVEALRQQHLDIGLCRVRGERGRQILEVERTIRDSLVAVVSDASPLASRTSISIGDLRDMPFVELSGANGAGLKMFVLGLCMTHGFTPSVVQEARELPTVIALAAAGLGVAVVPSTMRCVAAPGARYLEIDDKGAHPPLYLMHNPIDRSAAKYDFMAIAGTNMDELGLATAI